MNEPGVPVKKIVNEVARSVNFCHTRLTVCGKPNLNENLTPSLIIVPYLSQPCLADLNKRSLFKPFYPGTELE